MEDDVKVCRKRTCSRANILVVRPNSRYCSACGAKLKRWYDTSDTPPLLDAGPDHKSVTHGRTPTPTQAQLSHIAKIKGALMPATDATTSPTQPLLPERDEWITCGGTWYSYNIMLHLHNLQAYMEFDGRWDAYELYLRNNGVGRLTNHDAIKALVARVTAYAHAHDIDVNRPWPPVTTAAYTTKSTAVAAKASDTFTCENADIKGCPVAPTAEVVMPAEMYHLFIYLCKQYSTEWLAYLKGHREFTDKGVIQWHITSYYFPKQRCTGAHVDVALPEMVDGKLVSQIQPDTIGSIHSHVAMNVFFSGEDIKHFNFPCEMVINRNGDMDVAIAHTLDCGRTTRLGAKVYTIAAAPPAAHVAANEALKAQLTDNDNRSGYGRRAAHPGESDYLAMYDAYMD